MLTLLITSFLFLCAKSTLITPYVNKYGIIRDVHVIDKKNQRVRNILASKSNDLTTDDSTYGCFNENTFIMTRTGINQMKNLKQGDDILGLTTQNKPEFSKVKLWFHRDTSTISMHKTVKTNDGTLTSSFTHNIATINDAQDIIYKHIDNIKHNELLIGLNDSFIYSSKVIDGYNSKKQGMYAPFTELGNYFVSDDGNAFYLAHSFACITDPLKYENIIHNIFSAFEYINPFINDLDDDNIYINPIAKFMHDSMLNIYNAPIKIKNKLYNLRGSIVSGLTMPNNETINIKSTQNIIIPVSVGVNLIDFIMVRANSHIFLPSAQNKHNVCDDFKFINNLNFTA
jgi:hypothetical protein